MRKLLMVAAAAAIALVGLSANMCEDGKEKQAAPEQPAAPADTEQPAAAPEEPAAPEQPAQ